MLIKFDPFFIINSCYLDTTSKHSKKYRTSAFFQHHLSKEKILTKKRRQYVYTVSDVRICIQKSFVLLFVGSITPLSL